MLWRLERLRLNDGFRFHEVTLDYLTFCSIRQAINGNLHNLTNIHNLNNVKLSINTSQSY